MTAPATVPAALDLAGQRERHAQALLAAGHSPAQAALMSGMPLGQVDRLTTEPLRPIEGTCGRGWTVPIPEPVPRPMRCAYGLGCTGTPAADGMCARHEGRTPLWEPKPSWAKSALGDDGYTSRRKRRAA